MPRRVSTNPDRDKFDCIAVIEFDLLIVVVEKSWTFDLYGTEKILVGYFGSVRTAEREHRPEF